MSNQNKYIPSVSVTYAQNGGANKLSILSMRLMQKTYFGTTDQYFSGYISSLNMRDLYLA